MENSNQFDIAIKEEMLDDEYSTGNVGALFVGEIKQEPEVNYVCYLPDDESENRCLSSLSHEKVDESEKAVDGQLTAKPERRKKCKPHKSLTPRFECSQCDNTYASKQSLQYHLKAAHMPKPEKTFQCSFCYRKFHQLNFLKSHLRIHRDKPRYICDVCGKVEINRAYINRHIVIHRTEPQYQCDLCPKIFKTRKYVMRHVVTHFPSERIQCELCPKKVFPYNMKIHLFTHGKKPFACDLCDKIFVQKNKVAYHRRTHTGEKPHKCSACDKSFTYQQTLKDHFLIRHTNFSLNCKFCDKVYNSKQGLRSHINIHHKN